MQWLARAELASAVSIAGGLGVISARSYNTPEELRQDIRKIRSLTDRPFAVTWAEIRTLLELVAAALSLSGP